MPGDDVVGEPPHALGIAARGKILEGADADMARGDAGQHRARQRRLAQHALAGHDRGERPRGRNAQRRHRLADDVFAQHRTERGAAVAAARERRRARALELDVAADAVGVDHLAEQDGAAVAELRHEMAELVAGIGHRDRLGAVGHPVAGEDLGALGAIEQLRVEAEMPRERPVQLDQPGRGDRRRRDAGEEIRRQGRIGILEGEMHRHDRQDRRAPEIGNRLGLPQGQKAPFGAQNDASHWLPPLAASGKPSALRAGPLAPDSTPPISVSGTSMHRYRSHTCGALRESDIGQTVRLSGWVHRVRDHGGVLFIDLRDHYGISQCVADPDSPAFKEAEKLRSEWVVRIDGKIRRRPAGTENPDLPTGAVELYVSEIEVLGPAGELPLPVFGEQEYPEDIRLKYRFLDLRREKLHQNIMTRGAIVDSMRKRMKEQGFFEFQTPILTASSPEGARDFLVPSRIHPGKFYALPQAPQQYKQLLMMSGFDRYFQIAPCFRDEDPRADRLPGEFYQLDVEMSFVTQEDVFAAMEPVITGVFEEFSERQAGDEELAADSVRRRGPQIRQRQARSAQPDRHAGGLRAFPRLRLQGVRADAGRCEEPGLGDPRRRAAAAAPSATG